MKICCISDIHNHLSQVQIPECDILIIAGDLTSRGTIPELIKFNQDLKLIREKVDNIVCIAGNHDFSFQINPTTARALITNVTHYLEDSECLIQGVRIYGSPFQPEFFSWAFNLPRGPRLAEKWAAVPSDIDVLVTHGPPYGILDKTWDDRLVGCADLRVAIPRIKPRLHVFGHIHASYGVVTNVPGFEGTTFVNASICTEAYRPTNLPIVVGV